MIVDSDKHPEQNVYFIGAKLLELLEVGKRRQHDILILYRMFNSKISQQVSFDYYLLGLDWLFLLGLISVNEKGKILLCT